MILKKGALFGCSYFLIFIMQKMMKMDILFIGYFFETSIKFCLIGFAIKWIFNHIPSFLDLETVKYFV